MFPHPLTGGPTSPTLAVEVQLCPPGSSKPGRNATPAPSGYHVIQGGGATVVEGERLEWAEKESFILPPWSWHQHANLGGRGRNPALRDRSADHAGLSRFYREERAEG